ncbi:bucky ball-like [Trichomycterus rosablanca]|uniref:bucky ball-like n=1 Tax=Trichomycterus rosablanca TaxID=2290929 RepID=UPI002F35ADF8
MKQLDENRAEMEEPNKASHSVGGDRSVNHPKPFFYVQPPAQPFYAYQWHMNHPYSHHNFPGYGFHYGRPYMVPYSYLQYPGYVMPHAMHPVDYRRIYERNFPHSATCEVTLRQQQQQQGNVTQKETTCAGAQTEPCDALNKLIECLDQLHAADSSQTSGSVSPMTGDAKYVGETLERKPDSEEESSSSPVEHFIQEENQCLCEEMGKDEVHHHDCHSDSSRIQSSSGIGQGRQDDLIQDREGADTDEGMEWNGYNASRPSSHSSPARCSSRRRENQDLKNVQQRDVSDDHSCCILHLPFEKVLSSSVLGHSVTSSSLGSPLSYTYHPPKLAHERLSVLSPSLDELSSHDEVLSTDLDEIDLFPTRIYTRGKLSEVASRKGHASELCFLYPNRLTCTTCGSHSFRELNRSKTYRYKDFKDSGKVEGGSCEMGRTCEHCLQSVPSKSHVTKKVHPHIKQRTNTAQHRDTDVHEMSHSEHFYCEKCMSSPEKSTSHAFRAARPERRSRLTSDQLVWEHVSGNTRLKSCRAQPLPQRPQRQTKSRFKPHVCPGSRNNDDDAEEEVEDEEGQEMIQYHRGKGTTKRGGAPC